MSFLWIGWELFVNLVEEGMFCYLLVKVLGYNKDTPKRPYLGLSLLIIFTTILNISVSNFNVVIFLLLVADIIFATLCFESNYSLRFLWGCAASIIGIISNTIVFTLLSMFTKVDLNTLAIPSSVRIHMTMVYLVVCSIFYFALIQIKSIKAIMLPKTFRVALFVLLLFGIIASDELIGFSIQMHSNTFIDQDSANILGFIGGGYLFVLLGCIFLFEVLGIFYQKNSELSIKLHESNLQKSHFENIEASIQTLREWKHDYHHHIHAMQVLVENEEYSELKDYLRQLNTSFSEVTYMVSTGNATLDAILSSKFIIAKTKGITVEHTIFLPKKLSIPQTDLCVILGNLLDNAIESCSKLNLQQPPYINITMKIHKDMIYIKIINSSDGIYLFKKKHLVSTKKQPGHGYGCNKINKIIEDYGGFYNIEPQDSSFTTTIMIPLVNEEV